jgi:glycosyltransferase involved in cell wall biosynthesis
VKKSLRKLQKTTQKSISENKGNNNQPIDFIDSHYLYPDGVAVSLVQKRLMPNIPLVITERGSNVLTIANKILLKNKIIKSLHQADAIITVCKFLRDGIINRLGIPAEKIYTLRNGVDLDTLPPSSLPKLIQRQKLQQISPQLQHIPLTGQIVLSVGGLVARKGHKNIIEAVSSLENTFLLIVGQGEEQRHLMEMICHKNLHTRLASYGVYPSRRINCQNCIEWLI